MANFNLDDYVPVNQRLEKFREEYPEGRINTDIVAIDAEKGICVIKASVYRAVDDLEAAATGHAHEFRDDPKSFVNKTSYVENCETSAIGRALAVMGYDILGGIASREEMEGVQRQLDAPPTTLAELDQQGTSPAPQLPMPQQAGAVSGDPASEAQINFLRTLCQERDLDPELWVLQQVDAMPADLSKQQAKALIDHLIAQPKAMAAAAGGSAERMATKPQINAIAAIAGQHGVSVEALVNQAYEGIDDPEKLTVAQASNVIKTYGKQQS